MLARDYPIQHCSIARSLELIGERWTLLVLRDVFSGRRRFDQIQESLGVARNVLASRLNRLVDEGILYRHRYQERPARHEYRLTEKGLDLWPVLVSLLAWGDRHLPDKGGPPVVLVHRECGGRVNDRRICEDCGAELGVRDAIALQGEDAARALTAA
jgi:DNA-binding HxlR family transcriptional regulator